MPGQEALRVWQRFLMKHVRPTCNLPANTINHQILFLQIQCLELYNIILNCFVNNCVSTEKSISGAGTFLDREISSKYKIISPYGISTAQKITLNLPSAELPNCLI